MIGQTIKTVGSFETDEGCYVYAEEQSAPGQAGVPPSAGLSTNRVEFGPFDAATAQQTFQRLCRQYPLNMPTPTLMG